MVQNVWQYLFSTLKNSDANLGSIHKKLFFGMREREYAITWESGGRAGDHKLFRIFPIVII